MKMPTAELYLKEATVIYGFYLLTARLPELYKRESCKGQTARTCLTPNTGASFQLITRRVSNEYGIFEVQVVEMTEAAATKQASITTLHVSVV